MNLTEKINADLKSAMLARDEFATTVLRGAKSAILYEKVAQKLPRDEDLTDAQIENVLAREAKKRDDAIKIYLSANDKIRAEKEQKEKEILEKYLPAQLSDDEIREIVAKIVVENNFAQKDFGRAIAETKKVAGNSASGEKIAQIVKEILAK